MLFRLCYDKYIRTAVCKSYPDAYLRLMKDGLLDLFKKFGDPKEWKE
jgi:hypothetical protein